MLDKNSGHILNISTPASIVPWPGATLYTASRWAVTGFTKALRADLYGTNVKVSLLIPGEVSSNYFEANPGSHERLPALSKIFPVLKPEQVAAEVVRMVRSNKSQERVIPAAMKLSSLFGRYFPGTMQRLLNASGYTYRKHAALTKSSP